MSFNRLQSLPGGIMALPRLREVYMRNNNFTRGVREYGKLRPVRVAATFGVKTLLDKAAEVVMLEPSRYEHVANLSPIFSCLSICIIAFD